MNLFKFFRNQRGFTLLEIAVVLVVITILAGAAMPTVAKKVRIAYAQKTAQEIGIIQDASKNYYIDNKGWPASISTLQTAGYLSSVWSGNNPWGNAYAVSEGATPQTFKVSTTMPSELTGAATALLPSSSAVGGGSHLGDPGARGGALFRIAGPPLQRRRDAKDHDPEAHHPRHSGGDRFQRLGIKP